MDEARNKKIGRKKAVLLPINESIYISLNQPTSYFFI